MSYQRLFPRFWSTVLLAGLGFLVTLFLATFVEQLEQQSLQSDFAQVAESNMVAIRTNLDHYLEPLEAVAAFYVAANTMNRQKFSTFVRPFLDNRPNLHTIGWIPRVSTEQRPIYEAGGYIDGVVTTDFSQFVFTEYREGRFLPAGKRAEYYPIYYQEQPIESLPIGFDLGSEPTYRQALYTARNRAQRVAIVQPASMPKDDHAALVIQIFYPVYTVDRPKDTLYARVTGLVGFVFVVLRVHDVIADTLKHMASDDIHLDLYDQATFNPSTLSGQKLLYHYPPSAPDGMNHGASIPVVDPKQPDVYALGVTKSLTLAEQQWQVVLQPTAKYIAHNRRWHHWFVWVCGLFFTSSISLYLHLLADRKRQAESMVSERTEQLRQANHQLQETLQELQFQKTLLECTSEAAQDGILVVSPQRTWLFFNQRFLHMWQIPQQIADLRSSKEGLNWAFTQVVNSHRVKNAIENLYAHPDAQGYDEVIFKNGTVLEQFSAPVKGVNDSVFGRVWYYRDITQRKRTEEALRQSEARNRALVSALPDLLFRVHKDGTFLDYHGAAGYTPMKAPEEFLGRNVAEVFPAEAAQRMKERVAGVLASGEPRLVEYQMPMLDGALRSWEQRVVMINEEEVLLIIRDITARKQAEEALQISQRQLQEHQQREKQVVEEELARIRNQLVVHTRFATLGQVAATIAHELRNPLGAVRNSVYYIRRYLAQNQQELLEFLQIIDVEVTTADRIITDLLEMTRAKEPSIQQLDLCAVVNEIWRQIKQNSTVTFQCITPQEPFGVTADPTQLRQILVNLMTNAVQAMPGGGDLSITGTYQGDDTVITVQDSGAGVPAEMRERIFEPLFTTKAKGTGLGLTICRQIVERHNGTMDLIDSDRGAKFVIRLPYKPRTTASADAPFQPTQ